MHHEIQRTKMLCGRTTGYDVILKVQMKIFIISTSVKDTSSFS